MVAGQVPDDSPRHELDALWRATQDRLRASVPESTFRLWLEPLHPVGADADALYLTGPEGIRAWAERRYSSLIGQALADCRQPAARGPLHRRAGGPERGRRPRSTGPS